MTRFRLLVFAITVTLLHLPVVFAEDFETGATGGNQAFDNRQPTLGLNYFVQTQGVFPPHGSGFGPGQYYLGFVRSWAGTFTPGGAQPTEGGLVPINQNQALFSLFGTMYGGDGRTTFGLPDLHERIALHRDTGGSLGSIGTVHGADHTTLTTLQLPAHHHALPYGTEPTGHTGGGQSFSNVQPSQNLNYVIATGADFPGMTPGPMLGQVSLFGGNFAPRGWAFADGQELAIGGNESLFSILGTTYGGNGRTNFALPDLRGRAAVGADGSNWRLGTPRGNTDVTLTEAQMPAHDHTLLPVHSGLTEITGDGEAVSNVQPSLALNYLIATAGIYPSRSGNVSGETILGEAILFAGNRVPDGWMIADGELLPISRHDALFSLLGTIYGGDGRTTFALPDLRGAAAFHTDGFSGRNVIGSENIALNVGNLPSHTHLAPVPLPATLPLLAAALTLLTRIRRRLSPISLGAPA